MAKYMTLRPVFVRAGRSAGPRHVAAGEVIESPDVPGAHMYPLDQAARAAVAAARPRGIRGDRYDREQKRGLARLDKTARAIVAKADAEAA